jgi:hypothetical protein
VEEMKKRKERIKADRKKKREAIRRQLQSSGIFAVITASGSGVSSSSTEISDLLGPL